MRSNTTNAIKRGHEIESKQNQCRQHTLNDLKQIHDEYVQELAAGNADALFNMMQKCVWMGFSRGYDAGCAQGKRG